MKIWKVYKQTYNRLSEKLIGTFSSCKKLTLKIFLENYTAFYPYSATIITKIHKRLLNIPWPLTFELRCISHKLCLRCACHVHKSSLQLFIPFHYLDLCKGVATLNCTGGTVLPWKDLHTVRGFVVVQSQKLLWIRVKLEDHGLDWFYRIKTIWKSTDSLNPL